MYGSPTTTRPDPLRADTIRAEVRSRSARRYPRGRAMVLGLPLLAVAACSTPPDDEPVVRATLDPVVSASFGGAWTEPGPYGPVLVVGAVDAGAWRVVARATGLRLLADEDQGYARFLPFVEARSEGGLLRLRCQDLDNHSPSVAVRAGPLGGLHIVVTDEVGLESRVRELTIDYDLAAATPVEESFAPLLHPDPETVAGDDAFHLPLAFVRAGALALALVPDVGHLERNRRLPQALRAEVDLRRIRHGLGAWRAELGQSAQDPGQTVHHLADAGVAIQGERLAFSHWLMPTTSAAAGTTLDDMVDAVWQRLVQPWTRHQVMPAAPSFAQATTSLLDRAETIRGGTPAGPDDLAAIHALGLVAAAEADRTGLEQARSAARRMLGEPRTSGLVTAHLRRDARPIRLADLALTGHWLEGWRAWLADEAEELRRIGRILGRLLRSIQAPDGRLPRELDPDTLLPRSGSSRGDVADSAAAALFLSDLAADQDAEAAEACWLALRHLDQGVLSADCGALSMAALAAARLAEGEPAGSVRRGEAIDLLHRLLRRLGQLQQAWARPWRPEDRVGGLRTSHASTSWNDPHTALAATAFLRGYQLTDGVIFLRRGAAALRAALGVADTPAEHALAVLAAADTAQRLGQGVVDLRRDAQVGLDNLWIQTAAVREGTLQLRLLTVDGPDSARIRVTGLPPVPAGYRIEGDGTGRGGIGTAALAAGIVLAVQRVPGLTFLPPAEIARIESWHAVAGWRGELPDDTEAWLAIETERGPLPEVPLRPDHPRRQWSPAEPFVPRGLPVGELLSVRLVVRHGSLLRHEPAAGSRTVVVADMHCLDPGDDDERALVRAGASRVEVFGDGRERCRALPPGSSATWAIPVPTAAARLRLQLLLQGPVQVASSDRVLHQDPPDATALRWQSLVLSDRRLWQEGSLTLRIEAGPEPVQVARIRYLGEGHAAALTGATQPGPEVAGLRIAVLPLTFDDRPIAANQFVLQQAFFGGADHQMTPPPESRRTAGSAASLLGQMAGREAALVGTVGATLQVPGLAAELLGTPGARQDLAATLRAQVGAAAEGPVDLVVAVVGGDEAAPIEPCPGSPPVLFLSERSGDGSFLSCGRILAGLLTAGHDLPDLTSPDAGAFGMLDLTSGDQGHFPSGLAGVQLERLGWVDRVRMEAGRCEIPALTQDRALLAFAMPELTDRPALLVEDHHRDDDGGVLLLWDLPQRAVVLGGPGRKPARPRWLRIGRTPGAWATPFLPARYQELFTPPWQLDGGSVPALATPQGEAPWRLQLLPGDARHVLEARSTALVAEDWSASVWWTGTAAGERAPMPVATDLGPLGHVQTAAGLRVVPRPGGRIGGMLPLPPMAGLVRMFAMLQAEGGAGTTTVGLSAGRDLTRVDLRSGDVAQIEVDLPAQGPAGRLQLEVSAPAGGGPAVNLRSCRLVPRQPLLSWLTPDPAPAAVWSDGVLRSVALQLPTRAEKPTELPLPHLPGSSALRLRVGLPADAPPDLVVHLSADLRSRDGQRSWRLLDGLPLQRGAANDSATTVLLELPAIPQPEVMFLQLRADGPADQRVLLQTAEVVRP